MATRSARAPKVANSLVLTCTASSQPAPSAAVAEEVMPVTLARSVVAVAPPATPIVAVSRLTLRIAPHALALGRATLAATRLTPVDPNPAYLIDPLASPTTAASHRAALSQPDQLDRVRGCPDHQTGTLGIRMSSPVRTDVR